MSAPLDFENEYDEVRLENELQSIMERNDLLIKENEMFTAHLFRRQKVQEDGGQAPAAPEDDNDIDLDDPNLRLMTQAERLDTILFEEDAINADISALSEHAQRDVNSLREVLEESTIRCNEIKKDAYELRRDLIIGADGGKGEISAEKIVKYFQEKLENKQAQCDKLTSKNNSIKLAIQKCDLQIKQKCEQGENLHQIDFQQLQIENSQYNAKIEQRNKQLLKLKMTTGRTVQVLNSGKHELSTLLTENARLNKDISERQSQIKRLTEEHARAIADVEKSKALNKRSEDKLNSMEMPHIIDYVQQKIEAQSMMGVLKNWERKNEIVSIGTRRKTAKKSKEMAEGQLKKAETARLAADEAELKAHGGN